MSWPGVQNPHCAASFAMNARWSGDSDGSSPGGAVASPSTVTDSRAVAGGGEREARVHEFTVELNGAGAALAAAADELRPREGEPAAQQFEQREAGTGLQFVDAAVDGEAHPWK